MPLLVTFRTLVRRTFIFDPVHVNDLKSHFYGLNLIARVLRLRQQKVVYYMKWSKVISETGVNTLATLFSVSIFRHEYIL